MNSSRGRFLKLSLNQMLVNIFATPLFQTFTPPNIRLYFYQVSSIFILIFNFNNGIASENFP